MKTTVSLDIRLPTNRKLSHPGVMLNREFLEPLGVTQAAFAKHIGVTTTALSELIHGRRRVTVNTAKRLAMALGTSPEMWLNMQLGYDLSTAPKIRKKITRLKISR